MKELVLAAAAVLTTVLSIWALKHRAAPSGDDYVYVNDDGSVRRLGPDEATYLETRFLPSDGARPYIKSRYGERGPEGGLGGYLLRRRVPRSRRLP